MRILELKNNKLYSSKYKDNIALYNTFSRQNYIGSTSYYIGQIYYFFIEKDKELDYQDYILLFLWVSNEDFK